MLMLAVVLEVLVLEVLVLDLLVLKVLVLLLEVEVLVDLLEVVLDDALKTIFYYMPLYYPIEQFTLFY